MSAQNPRLTHAAHCLCGTCYERPSETARKRCTTCHKLYTTVARRQTAQWVDDSKRGCYCLRCGHSDHRALLYIHRPGTTKLFEVESCSRVTVDRLKIAIEIQKCDLLCRNCVAVDQYEASSVSRDTHQVLAEIQEREAKGKAILAALGVSL